MISNMYVVCPTPADGDPAWGLVVDRTHVRRSLDGKEVVLKWPAQGMPSQAECTRLGGTCYTYAQILVVVAGADWTMPQASEESPVGP
jgi:hypothetical protein